jgi:hypothetical protein
MNEISIFVANLIIEYQRMKDLVVAGMLFWNICRIRGEIIECLWNKCLLTAISNDIYRINSDKYQNAVEDQIAMMHNAMEEQKNIIEKGELNLYSYLKEVDTI